MCSRADVDGSIVRRNMGRPKRSTEQAIGITKGGRNSKIHGLVDKLCRPWVLILTPGNTADCTVGPACVSLLDGIAELLGDKAYDSNSFRKSLRKDGIKPVIPGRSNRKKRIRHDKQAYKDRNVIELQAHRNALRQTRSELLLSPVPRCRRGILALVVRGFRFWDNMASVSAPG